MAIMAMVTAKQINNFRFANLVAIVSYFTISSTAIAAEWQFAPSVGLEATYTDNIYLNNTAATSSIVSQSNIGLDADYQSRLAKFSFSGINNNLIFSHDSDRNNNYLTLDTNVGYYLWTSGPELFSSASVHNINRNSASNSLANLVSGDTVKSESYSTGLRYNIENSSYSIKSALVYNINKFDDDIGESDGIYAVLNTYNNNNARDYFWQINSSFTTRNQDLLTEKRTSDQFKIDAKLGVITSLNFNPFIRFYDENFSGVFSNQIQQTTSSWGPGIRWLVSEHLTLDLSYNYVTDDNTSSDNFLSTSIQWEPSVRTSLTAGYSQRFFGDSYNLDIKHKSKRLTNTISYKESIEVFDRNSFEQSSGNDLGLTPVESQEFSLYKRFMWSSNIQLARTLFSIVTYTTRREGLESKVINDTLGASFSANRKISGKSQLTLVGKYDYLVFNKNNNEISKQEDHYRTISATYTKDLASSLSAHLTIQHVNRNSNVEQFTYDELRASINVRKEF